MNKYKLIQCNECDMEYKIIWDDDNFSEPIICAACGAEDPEEVYSDTFEN